MLASTVIKPLLHDVHVLQFSGGWQPVAFHLSITELEQRYGTPVEKYSCNFHNFFNLESCTVPSFSKGECDAFETIVMHLFN